MLSLFVILLGYHQMRVRKMEFKGNPSRWVMIVKSFRDAIRIC